MELLKQLGTLIQKATSDVNSEPSLQSYEQILDIINSRVDMPKHTINGVSKRLSIKNKKVLYYCFDLLEYLSYRCELALYSQISTKEFLLKISGLLMSQDVDSGVQTKILQTIKCWDELFRPHEDLLPMFFQFYAGLLRKEFPIQNNYVSPHRPKDFKIYKKAENKKKQQNKEKPSKPVAQPTKTQQKTFQQIRQKLILTNEIIDNANPAEGVKGNQLLLEMLQQIKACQKKVNQTINENPNEKIMELALAAHDDIFITYRRFKDLQKNRKPQPFILTELESDRQKTYTPPVKSEHAQKKNVQKPSIPKDQFSQFEEKPKQQKFKKKQEIDIFDIACQPKNQKPSSLIDMSFQPNVVKQPQGGVNIFDLLGSAQSNQKQPSLQNSSNSYQSNNYVQGGYASNTSVNFTGMPVSNPYQSNNYANISLNGANNFTTENDIKRYDSQSIIDKITNLEIGDFLKK